MAQRKRLSADDITAVWFAPEQLRAERVQAAVDGGATAQEVADLASQAGQGEYREYLGEEEINGKIHGKFGQRLEWVHPDGDDEGWYERVADDTESYTPVRTGEEA